VWDDPFCVVIIAASLDCRLVVCFTHWFAGPEQTTYVFFEHGYSLPSLPYVTHYL
jgi:hypothetical protein